MSRGSRLGSGGHPPEVQDVIDSVRWAPWLFGPMLSNRGHRLASNIPVALAMSTALLLILIGVVLLVIDARLAGGVTVLAGFALLVGGWGLPRIRRPRGRRRGYRVE